MACPPPGHHSREDVVWLGHHLDMPHPTKLSSWIHILHMHAYIISICLSKARHLGNTIHHFDCMWAPIIDLQSMSPHPAVVLHSLSQEHGPPAEYKSLRWRQVSVLYNSL